MQAGQAFPYGYIDLARWQGMPALACLVCWFLMVQHSARVCTRVYIREYNISFSTKYSITKTFKAKAFHA